MKFKKGLGTPSPSPTPQVPSNPSSPACKWQQHEDSDNNSGHTSHSITFLEFDALPISAWRKVLWNDLLLDCPQFLKKKTETWRMALNEPFRSRKVLHILIINSLVCSLKTLGRTSSYRIAR